MLRMLRHVTPCCIRYIENEVGVPCVARVKARLHFSFFSICLSTEFWTNKEEKSQLVALVTKEMLNPCQQCTTSSIYYFVLVRASSGIKMRNEKKAPQIKQCTLQWRSVIPYFQNRHHFGWHLWGPLSLNRLILDFLFLFAKSLEHFRFLIYPGGPWQPPLSTIWVPIICIASRWQEI